MDEYLKTVDLSFFKPGDKWQRGDVKYIDSNHDGKVDSGKGTLADHGDLKVIGNATPKYSFGFNLNAGYKGFEVSALFQGVAKRQFPSPVQLISLVEIAISRNIWTISMLRILKDIYHV